MKIIGLSILNQLGFTYIWNSQKITKLQLSIVIQCVYDQYYKTYYESIYSSSKLETSKYMKFLCLRNTYHVYLMIAIELLYLD